MNASNATLFLRHKDGATKTLRGARLAKLLSELKAGRGMPEIMLLIDAGYQETLGGLDVSSLEYDPLKAEVDGKFKA